MISINTDSGVDIILDILRQSQAIRTNIENKEKDNALDTKKADSYNSYNPRASLRRPDTDKDIMFSRKGQQKNQRRSNETYDKTKGLIEGILNRMTAHDYRMLSKEGFRAEDLTIEALNMALQIIKDFSSDSVSRDKTSSKRREDSKEAKDSKKIKDTDKKSKNEIKKRMEDENLPINNDSIERIIRALELSESIPKMDKKDLLYLFNKDLKPSIENLYKAKFSNQSNEAHMLSDHDWKKLVPQVSEIIGDASTMDYNVVLEDARWLIENDIPLTKDNISLLTGLRDLSKDYDKDMIFDKVISGMKEGTLPGDVILIESDKHSIDSATERNISIETEENITQLVEDINSINESEIIRTVESNQDITIKNILQHREDDLSNKEPRDNLSSDQQAKLATAKRQLEEIRLKMTLEAARRLEKKGFHIETEALERVVERLRIEEEIYYKELYDQAIMDSEETSFRLLQLTSESMDELKVIPAHVLGKTLSERRFQTVSGLLTAGRDLIVELDKAKEAYEALFTVPKSEYGDSIKKAFSNTGSLMEEMGIENTEYNQRAIRILGYNRMEITKEAIEEVKAYDLSVNHLIQNLNPAVAIQIVKDGVNPMDIPIDELNSRIEILKEQGYSSLEKYSSFLYKLEQKEGLTEAERKSYIGIYRLLYHIEKSDGAALGALIKADQEVTLNHLLTAIRTNKRGGMDYSIDDEFGVLSELTFEKESISDQLRAIFHDKGHEDMVNGMEANSHEGSVESENQKAIIKELLNSLTPEKLDQLHNNIQNVGREAEGEALAHTNFWETIGRMTTEQLLDQIKGIQTSPGEDQTYYYERLREMQEVYSNSDQAIRFLDNFKLPCTTNNLMMAGQLLSNSGNVFKKLFGLIDSVENEKSQNSLKKKLELSDTLIDNETMTEAYEDLEQEVKALIGEKAIEDNIESNSLTQLKTLGMQMHFIKDLAKREFYQIPIEVSGRFTNINLTIIRGKASGGKVTVTLISEKLGSIKAEASLKDSKLSGYIACDHIGSLKIMETLTDPLISVVEEESITIKQLNFCLQQAPDAIYTHQNSWDLEGDTSPENERILYRLAKAMIHMIRSAEEADSAVA